MEEMEEPPLLDPPLYLMLLEEKEEKKIQKVVEQVEQVL